MSTILSSINASVETPIFLRGHFLAALTGLFVVFALVRIVSKSRTEFHHTKDSGDKTMLPMSSLTTAWPFFHQRFDFLNAGFRSTGQSIFKFNVFQVKALIVCLPFFCRWLIGNLLAPGRSHFR
jgi:hypothetical protein